jgi:Protein of unknown function (DUF3616)
MPDTPKSSPILRLDPTLSKKELAKIRDNFSAVVLHGSHLWLGGDEGTSLDRMTRDAVGNFGSHTRFDLAPLLRLPGGGAEIDIEGLDVDGGYLCPTMDLDGPVFIHRSSNALEQGADSLTFLKDLKRVVSVPFGIGKDHAEGLTLLPGDALAGMVCYDSPDAARIEGINEDGVRADVFSLNA